MQRTTTTTTTTTTGKTNEDGRLGCEQRPPAGTEIRRLPRDEFRRKPATGSGNEKKKGSSNQKKKEQKKTIRKNYVDKKKQRPKNILGRSKRPRSYWVFFYRVYANGKRAGVAHLHTSADDSADANDVTGDLV